MNKMNQRTVDILMRDYSLEKQNIARLIWDEVMRDEPGIGIGPNQREGAYRNIHAHIVTKEVSYLEYLHGDMIIALHEEVDNPNWAELPPIPK